jgi:hypothetical protein
MLKIQFTNAQVEDNGYGLKVNGKDLDKIISTALGTRVGDKCGYGSGIPSFESNCCNVTIVIDPQPVTEEIETKEELWHSVVDLEATKREQYKEKAGEAES